MGFYDVRTNHPNVTMRIQTQEATTGPGPAQGDIGSGKIAGLYCEGDAGWDYANKLGGVLEMPVERTGTGTTNKGGNLGGNKSGAGF